MRFGIYVHLHGPFFSPFAEVARDYDQMINEALQGGNLGEIDGLILSFDATSDFESGIKRVRRKVRRNHTVKLITGGFNHYNCLITVDAQVADAEVIDASSETALFEYVRALLLQVLPKALAGFPAQALETLGAAVSSMNMQHAPRW